MGNKATQITLLALLLFSQMAEAFACQSISCMEETEAVMMADGMEMKTHTGHNIDAINTGTEGSAMCECCQQQCSCPPTIMTFAILLDNHLITRLDLASFKQAELITRIVSAILNTPQRPPRPFISLAA